MDRFDLYRQLAIPSEKRVLFMVIDGLGGLPHPDTGETELEAAHTPTLDRLAREGECGLTVPVLPGVTPGSGPAHIALFGYDPVRHQVGRGVLAALGVGVRLLPGDVAARINFCTLDSNGNVVDRRAGRIGDEEGEPLAHKLDALSLEGDVRFAVRHVKQYRACVVFRGDGLDGRIADTDPQAIGVPPLAPEPLHPDAGPTAAVVGRFIAAATEELADQERANGVLLWGVDTYEPLPTFQELYGLEAVAIAAYPMYRGVARLVGMTPVSAADDPVDLAAKVKENPDADFVFLHYKSTDSRGEDGDYDGKVREIERADALLAEVRDDFDVVMVTGDHSTPSSMRAHSWHPVPLLIASEVCRGHSTESFGERACAGGPLGHVASTDVLPLVLAHAGRLKKFGA